jgi:hypothetical protein
MVKARSAEVDEQSERDHRENGQDQAEAQRFATSHPAIGNGTLCRSRHNGIDIGVVPHVERA